MSGEVRDAARAPRRTAGPAHLKRPTCARPACHASFSTIPCQRSLSLPETTDSCDRIWPSSSSASFKALKFLYSSNLPHFQSFVKSYQIIPATLHTIPFFPFSQSPSCSHQLSSAGIAASVSLQFGYFLTPGLSYQLSRLLNSLRINNDPLTFKAFHHLASPQFPIITPMSLFSPGNCSISSCLTMPC